jgi:long-chain acyl-CoA synthetase
MRLAGGLRKLGVGPGDRVAVMTPNCPEVGVTYVATWRVGGVTVPILFLLALPEVTHILADSQPKVVVTSPEFVGVVQQAIAGIDPQPQVLLIGDATADGALSMSELIASTEPDPKITPREPNDLAGINYTSGTTGRPKGVMLSHGGMVAVSDAVIEVGELENGKVALAALPLAHGYGILTQLVGMRLWGTGVLMRWFDPGEALRLIDEYKVQNFAAVPTMLVYLLNHPDRDKYDGRSLERVSSGAAPCPLEVMEAFEKRFDTTVYEGYGLTESTIVCCTQRPSEGKVVGSVGRALPGIDVKILDDDHNEMPIGELGEICVRGPNVMPGYYRLPEVTAETVRDGWLHSGDIGRQDASGHFYVVERKKDMIIRGGFNVYPRDIEEVLFEHPAIAEAAVVGRPDPEFGEEVVAFVVRRPGQDLTEQELIDFCRSKLAKYKTPKEVHFTDQLPKNQVGKILRRELRAQLTPAAAG